MTAVFPPTPSFRYLSSGGEWPELARFGLVTRDGALELPALPGPDPASAAASGTAALQGPARIAVTAGGTVYVVDPEASRIRRIGCDGLEQCFDCRDADEESLLSGPRGVLIGPRGRLFVADTGHHRVVILDPATAALAGVWGQASPWSEPTPSPDDGRFQSPWDLAADFRGRVYVADAGAQDAAGKWSGGRVQRFDVDGGVQPSFWQTMRAQSTVPSVPTSIAVVLLDADDPSSERLLVLDAEPARLLVYTLDGVIDDDATDVWSNVARAIGAGGAPIDLAWGPEALYVADGVSGRVFVFGRDGAYLGTARTPSC